MSLSIFEDKAIMPNVEAIANVLGKTAALWDQLYDFLKDKSNATGDWKFYSKKAGWSYGIKSGKRTLLYLIPQDDYFKITFVFGEKAVNEAKKANLPDSILHSIAEATPYAEGRSFMIDVRSNEDIEVAKRLLTIKENN